MCDNSDGGLFVQSALCSLINSYHHVASVGDFSSPPQQCQLKLFGFNEPRCAEHSAPNRTCSPVDARSGNVTHALIALVTRHETSPYWGEAEEQTVRDRPAATDGVRGVRYRGGMRGFRVCGCGRVAHTAGGGSDIKPGTGGVTAQVRNGKCNVSTFLIRRTVNERLAR